MEAAKTLAFSGQGHRAAETLRSTIELNPQSTAGQSALDLLKEWGLEKDDLKDQERVNTVVRNYLDNQFAAMSDMAQIETLIALHHSDEAGNRLVSMLKRNIRGEQLSRSISRFLRRWGISEDGSALSAGQLPSSEIHARLQKGISIKTFLEQTEFLQAVEPESGKQMSRMLRELHPEVAWIENAANERDESESGDPRTNFFRRVFHQASSVNWTQIWWRPISLWEKKNHPKSSNREATTNEEPLSFDQVRNLRLIGSSDLNCQIHARADKSLLRRGSKFNPMALQSKIEASNKARIPGLSLPSPNSSTPTHRTSCRPSQR